jgi:hypothetical protein
MSNTAEGVPDPLVLAAIDRAERHNPAQPPGVPIWSVCDHLSIPRRSGSAQRVRAQLDALEGAGSVERSRRHGAVTWALTSTGRRRLTRARSSGSLPELPESPQHRKWREARAGAEQEIERLRLALLDDVELASGLLDPPHLPDRPDSDVLLELGERLQRACRRLASSTHCLYEWPEPDDATADVDDYSDPSDEGLDEDEQAKRRRRRIGRRNAQLWQETTR